MNSEERDLISRFIARVGGGQGATGNQISGSPANLPPIDPEADRFIAENFQRYPEARYRVTQLAVVQEAALAQAQNRIRELELQLQQARTQQTQPQNAQSSGGFFSGLFRGNTPPPQQPSRGGSLPPGWGAAAVPSAGYAQPAAPQASMFPRSGSGFLGSALTTAAGVAGGIMAADALENLFSGHHGHGGTEGGGFSGGGDTTIVNNYGDTFGSGPFDASGSDPFSGSMTDTGGGFGAQDFAPQEPQQPQQQEVPEDFGGDTGGSFGGDDFF